MAKKRKKKSNINSIVLLIGLIFLWIALFSIYIYERPITGETVFEPDTPENCTQTDVGVVWDTIFDISSSGITILNSSEGNGCGEYIAHKIIDDKELFIIKSEDSIPPNVHSKNVEAVHGNFSSDQINIIKDLTDENVSSFYIDVSSFAFTASNRQKNITNTTTADSIYYSYFAISQDSDEWENGTDLDDEYYVTDESDTVGDDNNEEIKAILKNKTMEIFIFEKITDCTPNWTLQTTPCKEDETQIEHYIDENNCGDLSSIPDENKTIHCDYDGNNLIGNQSEINAPGIDLSVEVDDEDLNESKMYIGDRKIEIYDDTERLVKFDWDFTDEAFDFKKVKIEIQDSGSDFGYIIVEGINEEKEVRLDKISNDSEAVCIKDSSSVDSISEISDDCLESNEEYVICPGESDDGEYICAVNSERDKLIVSGLSHSGVKEYVENDTGAYEDAEEDECTPDWTCTNWSECSNGMKYRTCTDSNMCGSTQEKPEEEETCTVSQVCTPDWVCTDWQPGECPTSGEQTRTCTDENNCPNAGSKPRETRTCEPEGGSGIFIIIMILIFLGLAGAVTFLLLRKKLFKSKKPDSGKEPGDSGPGYTQPRPPGPGPPGSRPARPNPMPMQKRPQAPPVVQQPL
ncbi:hypothetical protein GF378_01530 [Candidatus Pacearchaeota archaeon]|nr:hypothetical protein [Candidatus Pacearchaeota archaeon]